MRAGLAAQRALPAELGPHQLEAGKYRYQHPDVGSGARGYGLSLAVDDFAARGQQRHPGTPGALGQSAQACKLRAHRGLGGRPRVYR